MTRSAKRIAGLAIALAVCVVLYLLALILGADRDETAKIKFSDIKASDITTLRWTYNEKTVELEKREDAWVLTDDDSYPLDEEMVDAMVDAVTKIKASNKIEAPVLSEYGLDGKSPSVWVGVENGEKVSFTFGDTNDLLNRCYLLMSGGEDVYFVSVDMKSAFEVSVEDIRKKDAIPAISGINEIRMTIMGDTVLDIKSKLSSRGEMTWLSCKNELDLTKVEALCSGLDSLQWTEDFINTNPTEEQLEEYGLTGTALEIYWSNGSEEATIELGTQLPDGSVYGRLKGSQVVHTLSGDVANFMVATEEDLM